MIPLEMAILADMRRDAFEREVQLQCQLAQLPKEPARWRLWTGGGMMWAGTRLVRWGEGMKMTECSQGVEVVA
jgi:hypothetical protein